MQSSRSLPQALSVVLLSVLSALTSLALAGGPSRVGELEQTTVASAHPYAPGRGQAAREWTVHHAGATYIRIHFHRLDLAPGDRLEIRSPDGSQVFSYGGPGAEGRSEFWANTILGDTAVLRLEAIRGGGFGFQVDRYGRGTVALEAAESSCGATDWEDAVCYEGGPHQAAFVRSRSAVRLVIGCCDICTGFPVSDTGQYLTSYSCISSNPQAKDTEFLDKFQAPECGAPATRTFSRGSGQKLLAKNPELGYSLVQIELPHNRLKGGRVLPIRLQRCLKLAESPPVATEPIYIPHYPGGLGRQLSIFSDADPGEFCEVGSGPSGSSAEVGYLCDTGLGSQGAPVLSATDHTVLALHQGDGCPNVGISADRILAEIAEHLDACSPVPATCGNGAIDDPLEQCDGDALGGVTCEDLGALFGELACSDDCTFDRGDCFSECFIIPNGLCNCDRHCTGKEKRGGVCPFDCD